MTHASNGPPCRALRPLLDQAADAHARGLGAWYARLHAARCPNCGLYLESLRQIAARLRQAPKVEDDEAIARLTKALE